MTVKLGYSLQDQPVGDTLNLFLFIQFNVSKPMLTNYMRTISSLGRTRTLVTNAPFSRRSKLGSKTLSAINRILIRDAWMISRLHGISMSSINSTNAGFSNQQHLQWILYGIPFSNTFHSSFSSICSRYLSSTGFYS